VASVESVIGKLRHQVEDLFSLFSCSAARFDRTAYELGFVRKHSAGSFLPIAAAHQVGIAREYPASFCASCMICS
jgi:hypothetical protein